MHTTDQHDQEVSKLAIFAFSFFAIISVLFVSATVYLGYVAIKYGIPAIHQSMMAESAKP
jgi:hypothetical protein